MRGQTYALQSVADDLEHLNDSWRDGATDVDLRRGSAILRRFLVDNGQGVLIQVWRDLGFAQGPAVVAPSLSLAESGKVILATAGGARVNGIQVAGYLRAAAPIDDGFDPEGREQHLIPYVSAPCIVVHGRPISRRELVNYFANDLGGVHLSWRAKKKQGEYVRLFQQIEEMPIQAELLGKDLLHFELLAIGQAIGQSADMLKLAKTIRAMTG